jgi:hypothetical protein
MGKKHEITSPPTSEAKTVEQYYKAALGLGDLTVQQAAYEQIVDTSNKPYTKLGIELGNIKGTYCVGTEKPFYGAEPHIRVPIETDELGPMEINLCITEGRANFKLYDLEENKHLAPFKQQ